MCVFGVKFVVCDSIRLAWVVLGWFVMVNSLGWYWAGFGGKCVA